MEIADELTIFDEELITKLNQLASNKIEYWDIKSGVATGTNLDFKKKAKNQLKEMFTRAIADSS